jgi:hypothetical protein
MLLADSSSSLPFSLLSAAGSSTSSSPVQCQKRQAVEQRCCNEQAARAHVLTVAVQAVLELAAAPGDVVGCAYLEHLPLITLSKLLPRACVKLHHQ